MPAYYGRRIRIRTGRKLDEVSQRSFLLGFEPYYFIGYGKLGNAGIKGLDLLCVDGKVQNFFHDMWWGVTRRKPGFAGYRVVKFGENTGKLIRFYSMWEKVTLLVLDTCKFIALLLYFQT